MLRPFSGRMRAGRLRFESCLSIEYRPLPPGNAAALASTRGGGESGASKNIKTFYCAF
jgi:hypothetical protein